ncbi:bifunctional DNA primase/polymerase [Aeoliella sp.]|uniref:bifunctional DNA primase/polymerase n=1 Tax=Aeoliella sp. TaxID=2795800 RepID=UPI003CCBCEAD
MLDAALELAELGYSAFPVKPGRKEPATLRGCKDATTSEQMIRMRWHQTPNANVGMSTEGLLVVDIDGADNPLMSDAEKMLDLSVAPFSETPRGGRHYFFQAPPGKWKNSSSKLAPNVDTRADGGYVLVAPSRVVDAAKAIDGEYRWLQPLDVPPDKLPLPPTWVVDGLRKKEKKQKQNSPGGQNGYTETTADIAKAVKAMAQSTANMEDGNDGSKRLFTAACRAVELDLSDQAALTAIRKHAESRPFPKCWTDAEILQRVRDAEQSVPRGSRVEISNGATIEVKGEDGEITTITVPKTMREVLTDVLRISKGWPRRMSGALFIDDKQHGIGWLEKTPEVFGWLSNFGLVNWHDRKQKFVRQSEFVAELRRTAQSYEAVELLPHEPSIANIYYRRATPPEGDGSHLRKLLDFFRPETTVDRDLIEAAFLTPFWGGPPGSRPAIVVTSRDGRGAGKSKLAEAISFLAGGFIDVSTGEDIGTLKQRFLSPEGLTRRVAIIDNVKSLKFSWAELEALITTPIISGKALYIGEMQRPNLITWMMTLNGVSLATDLAQRAIIINLVKGKNDGTWYERLIQYIDHHRESIIGDIIGRMRSEPHPLPQYTRWAAWEKDVLSRLAEPGEAQRVIAERQGEADCEADEAGIIEDFFAQQIARCGQNPKGGQYRLPVSLVATWYAWATNDKAKTAAVSKRLKQMADEGAMKRLAPDPSRTHGRCFVWTGPGADVIRDPIDNWFTSRSSDNVYRQAGEDVHD